MEETNPYKVALTNPLLTPDTNAICSQRYPNSTGVALSGTTTYFSVFVLSKPKGRLHLFDLPLYRRKDGSYVLHRVVNFGSDGSYTMCGDNQFAVEKGITDDDVIGVVTAFYRKGKPYTVDSMKYRAYLEFMFYSKPLRKVIASTVSRSKNAFSKLKTKKGKK